MMNEIVFYACRQLAARGSNEPLVMDEGLWTGHPGLTAVRLLFAVNTLVGNNQLSAPLSEEVARAVDYCPKKLADLVKRACQLGERAYEKNMIGDENPFSPDEPVIIERSAAQLDKIAFRNSCQFINDKVYNK